MYFVYICLFIGSGLGFSIFPSQKKKKKNDLSTWIEENRKIFLYKYSARAAFLNGKKKKRTHVEEEEEAY
jgi:hypothetical protein